jgi:hypothetical protein
MSHKNQDPGIEQVNSEDLPIYSKSTLPDDAFLILLANEQNFDFGGTIQNAYRLDLDRVIPNNTKQGVTYSLQANGPDGADISIPDGTVVPAYVETFDPYRTLRAQASSQTTKAQFLIISLNQNVDENYIIQSSGFYTFPTTHNYDIGKTYYLSDSAAGGVTDTPPSSIVQPLFQVVDERTILVKIGE